MSEKPTKRNSARRQKRNESDKKLPEFERGFWSLLNFGSRLTTRGSRAFVSWARQFTEYAESGAQPAHRRTAGDPFRRFLAYILNAKFTYAKFIVAVLIITVVGVLMLTSQTIAVDKHDVKVMSLSNDLEGFTVLHLSDLHGSYFAAHQSGLTRTINGLKYDAIVMTGDMVGRGSVQATIDLLNGLTAVKPVYYIVGDSDPAVYAQGDTALNDWAIALSERGAQLLDAPLRLNVGSASVWFVPDYQFFLDVDFAEQQLHDANQWYELSADDEFNATTLNTSAYRTLSLTRLKQARAAVSARDLVIGVGHYPQLSTFITAQAAFSPFSADIFLSGHTSGGVWQVPYYGALFIPMPELPRRGWFPDAAYVGGMSAVDGTYRYVNVGLGCTNAIWLPRFRLFNPPSVALLKFTGKL